MDLRRVVLIVPESYGSSDKEDPHKAIEDQHREYERDQVCEVKHNRAIRLRVDIGVIQNVPSCVELVLLGLSGGYSVRLGEGLFQALKSLGS